MLRILVRNATSVAANILKGPNPVTSHVGNVLKINPLVTRAFTSLISPMTSMISGANVNPLMSTVVVQKNFPIQEQTRTVTKFSMRSGKRKSVKPVLKRFLRLNWGGWIRTRTGRNKKMWKRTAKNKHRMRQHVLVSASQAWFLDKCVTKFWRRPKYYVDDLYAPYHDRPYFFATKNSKWIK